MSGNYPAGVTDNHPEFDICDIETSTLIECPTCGGDGEFNEGPHPTMLCPTCRGKGRIEEDRRLVDEDDLDDAFLSAVPQ